MLKPFVIPIWKETFPDFENKKQLFLDSVVKYKELNPISDQYSNFAGYQSPKELHSVPDLTDLFNFVCSVATTAANDMDLAYKTMYISTAWANFNDSRQAMNHQHIHADVLSGVFYLQIPEGSGKLSIVNPGMNCLWPGYSLIRNRNEYTADALSITPHEGELVLWPSYLPHSVETNNHDKSRISIAINIMLE